MLHLKLDRYFPNFNFQSICPNLIQLKISAPSNLLNNAKKYFAKHPLKGETKLIYVKIGDKLEYMERHRDKYEERMRELAELETERYRYDDYDSDRYDHYDDYDYDRYSYERTHDTEESYLRKTWNS